MAEKRKQINFRTDDAIEAIIDRLRRKSPPPLPRISDVIRQALVEKDARERDAKRGSARR